MINLFSVGVINDGLSVPVCCLQRHLMQKWNYRKSRSFIADIQKSQLTLDFFKLLPYMSTRNLKMLFVDLIQFLAQHVCVILHFTINFIKSKHLAGLTNRHLKEFLPARFQRTNLISGALSPEAKPTKPLHLRAKALKETTLKSH